MLVRIIDLAFSVYYLLILIRVIASWIPELQRHHFMHFVYHYTEPYLGFFRRLIPPIGMLDISVLVAFLMLGFLKSLLLSLVWRLDFMIGL